MEYMSNLDKRINFSKELIKGKIAEIIFEQMFRETGKFTILRLGYEYTSPELAQYQNLVKVKQVLDIIRHTPDFVLVTNDKTEDYIVEVKYRSKEYKEEIISIAEKISKNYNPSFLFIASPHGFYFSSCNDLVRGEKIKPLSERWVPQLVQQKYLKLLQEFEHR